MKEINSLGVVIVTHNSFGFLAEALYSYLDAGISASNIVVIDNKSIDTTEVDIPRLFPDVRYRRNEENFGYAKAINLGVTELLCEYIVISNPDIIVTSEALRICLHLLDQNEGAGVVGCTLMNQFGKNITRFSWTGIISAVGMLMFNNMLNGIVRISNQLLRKRNAPSETRFVEGSFMMLRRKAFNSVSGFDEQIFLFSEDADFSLRLAKQGWKLIHMPTAKITHIGSVCFEHEGAYFKMIEFYRGLLYFYRKHFPIRHQLLRGALWIVSVLKLCASRITAASQGSTAVKMLREIAKLLSGSVY